MNFTHLTEDSGFLLTKLSEEELSILKYEIDTIQNDFDSYEKINDTLVGNIEHEYELINSKKLFESVMLKYVDIFENQCGHLSKKLSFITNPRPLKLEKLWVNFQKKYEFNPPHNHNGLLSFVIWIKIPYKRKDEDSLANTKNSISPCSGSFSFLHTTKLGKVTTTIINLDKDIEGYMCLFPSELMHEVYPFYTSDEYRISVSGNIYLST